MWKLKGLVIATIMVISYQGLASNCQNRELAPCAKNLSSTQCLFNYIQQRACLIKPISAFKYLNHKSVYAADFELVKLKNAEKFADEFEINPTSLKAFVQIQMNMSKQIEAYWQTYWKKNQITPDTSQSFSELREEITVLDTWIMLQTIKSLKQLHNQNQYQALIKQINLTLNVKGLPQQPNFKLMLLQALLEITSN